MKIDAYLQTSWYLRNKVIEEWYGIKLQSKVMYSIEITIKTLTIYYDNIKNSGCMYSPCQKSETIKNSLLTSYISFKLNCMYWLSFHIITSSAHPMDSLALFLKIGRCRYTLGQQFWSQSHSSYSTVNNVTHCT